MADEHSTSEEQLTRAGHAALASLLNLTVVPVIAFLALLFFYRGTRDATIDRYHVNLGVKLNIIAAITLILVSALMIYFGGFDSPWTWVYVICYFTTVHTAFIIVAVWALVRAWSGQKLKQ